MIRKSVIIDRLNAIKGDANGFTRDLIHWFIKAIQVIPEEDHTRTIAQLEQLKSHCEDMRKSWCGAEEENPWSNDVAALNAAIDALRKEEA